VDITKKGSIQFSIHLKISFQITITSSLFAYFLKNYLANDKIFHKLRVLDRSLTLLHTMCLFDVYQGWDLLGEISMKKLLKNHLLRHETETLD
jgi:hypothetical protein